MHARAAERALEHEAEQGTEAVGLGDRLFEDEDEPFDSGGLVRLLSELPAVFWHTNPEYEALMERRLDAKDDVWHKVARRRQVPYERVRDIARRILLGHLSSSLVHTQRERDWYLDVWEALKA